MTSDAEALGRGALDLGMKYAKSQLPSLASMAGIELPSLSSLLGPGVGGAMAGAAAAMGPAAIALAVAKMLSMIAPPDDTAVTLGGGRSKNLGNLELGKNLPWNTQAQELYDFLLSDGAWAEGGDKSRVGEMDVGVGSMSMKKNIPFNAIEGWPYASKELSAGSGREIARSRMGLPVEHENIPRDAAGIAQMLNSKSIPVVDAPTDIDHEQWQRMLDARNSASGSTPGEGADTSGVEAYRNSLDPRMLEFFDLGLTPGVAFAHTGEHMVPKDYASNVEKEVEKALPAPEAEDDVMANMSKNSYLAKALGGTGEDVVAAVIEPWEAELLKLLGGRGTIDPKSGALEFESPLDDFVYRDPHTGTAASSEEYWGSFTPNELSDRQEYTSPDRTPGQTPRNSSQPARDAEADQARLDNFLAKESGIWMPDASQSSDVSSGNVADGGGSSTPRSFTRGGNSGNLTREQVEAETRKPVPSTNTTGAQFDLVDQFLKAQEGAPSTIKPPLPNAAPVAGYQGISWGNRPGSRLDYIDTHGVVPFAKYNTGEDNTSFLYMPNDMNATTRKTLETIDALSDNDFNALAAFLGMDPNSEWADEAIYEYFGTHKDEPVGMTYGPTGWTYHNPDPLPSALESGNYLYRGANISMEDILSGDVPSQAALELAWAAGANQEDLVSYAKSYGNKELGGRKLNVNDPEFIAARVRAEKATPIFNSYMDVQRAKEAARMGGSNAMLGGSGAIGGSIGGTGDAWRSAGSVSTPAPEMFTDNGMVLFRYADGTVVDQDGWQLIPYTFSNGMKGYWDTNYGYFRGPGGLAYDSAGNLRTDINYNVTPGYARDSAPNGEGGPQPWAVGRFPNIGAGSPPSLGVIPTLGGGGGSTVPGGGGGSTDDDDDPQAILDRILAAYPGDYASTRLGPELDDPFIAELLASERTKAQDVINRARASGQLTDVGANTALSQLLGPASATAMSTLNELSGDILGGYRQDINDIIAELVDRASVEPNVSFNPYNTRINSLVEQVKANYLGELIRALGSNSLFDTAALINAGGMAQSPISGNNFNPAMMF